MKTLFLLMVIIILPGLKSFSQENFKVIKVNGTIILKDKGVSLETGTVFSDKEDLLFRSEDASAAVINSQKGRLILTNKSHDLATAKSNFLPSMYNISSRGGSFGNLVDLKNYFSEKCVVLDKQYLTVNDASFPMDNNHFFFFRYVYNGSVINKKLSFSGDTLFIDKRNLYTVDGKPIPSPDNTAITLFYMKGTEYVLINSFDLIFPNTDQLKKEVRIILNELKDKSFKEKLAEVSAYINEEYGKVYQINLLSWLETNFGLKAQ
jgi:hypothetical protein